MDSYKLFGNIGVQLAKNMRGTRIYRKKKIKAVNSPAPRVSGIARAASIRVGSWKAHTNFTVVPMDDFQVIIGLEFMRQTMTAVMPHNNAMVMMGEKPCTIATMSTNDEGMFLSAMQVKRGVKRRELTWVAALRLEESMESERPLPKPVKKVLKQFANVMPAELPKQEPPRRGVDHEIELVAGAKPPARAPYRMAIPEWKELRKQLTELIDAGYIRPSKAPYGAPVLFQKKHDGSLRMCIDYQQDHREEQVSDPVDCRPVRSA